MFSSSSSLSLTIWKYKVSSFMFKCFILKVTYNLYKTVQIQISFACYTVFILQIVNQDILFIFTLVIMNILMWKIQWTLDGPNKIQRQLFSKLVCEVLVSTLIYYTLYIESVRNLMHCTFYTIMPIKISILTLYFPHLCLEYQNTHCCRFQEQILNDVKLHFWICIHFGTVP